jgi:hypothetical protein
VLATNADTDRAAPSMTRKCVPEMGRGKLYLPTLIFIEPVSRLPPLVKRIVSNASSLAEGGA